MVFAFAQVSISAYYTNRRQKNRDRWRKRQNPLYSADTTRRKDERVAGSSAYGSLGGEGGTIPKLLFERKGLIPAIQRLLVEADSNT
jgi:hypothetical protein